MTRTTMSCEPRFGRPGAVHVLQPGDGAAQHRAEEGDGRPCCWCWRWPAVLGRRRRAAAARHGAASPAIGAIGLDLVTGYAGQVSLGHAFFLGHRRLHRGGASRRPGRPAARLRHHRGAGLAAGRRGMSPRWPARWSRRWPSGCAGCTWRSSRSVWSSSGEYVFGEWTRGDRRRRTSAGPRRCRRCSATRLDVDGPSLHPRPEALPADARAPGDLRPARPQPRAVARRPGLRRDPRPRHRRRGDRREPHPVQDDRVRGVVVLRRGRRRAAVRHPADVHRPATSTC